jgi:hypothetical protein
MGLWELTPGEIDTKVNPSFANDCPYCRVSMLSAALAILYAGTGKMLYFWAMAIEPRVVELEFSVKGVIVPYLSMSVGILHVRSFDVIGRENELVSIVKHRREIGRFLY